jgi:hypothetical protein
VEVLCSKPFPGGTKCGVPATHAYQTRGKPVVYRCDSHPINNKKRVWNEEYRKCKRLTLDQAVVIEVMGT